MYLSWRRCNLFVVLLYIIYRVVQRYHRQSETVSQIKPALSFHRCTIEAIPYISQSLETAEYLLYTNKSFVRFGDGEVLLMSGKNISFQDSDQTLSDSLLRVLKSSHPQLAIGVLDIFSGYPPFRQEVTRYFHEREEIRRFLLKNLPRNRRYFSSQISSIYIHSYGTDCNPLREIYDTLRRIWMNRRIVIIRGDNGQHYDNDIYDTALSQTVIKVSPKNAWRDYSHIKQLLLHQDPTDLIILSCGPVSKVLVLDMLLAGRRALDLGHLAKDYDYYVKNKDPLGFYAD